MILTLEKISENTIYFEACKKEIEVYEIEKFKDEIDFALEDGSKNVIIDLGNIEYIDSSGIGVLIRLHKKLSDENFLLILCNLSVQTVKIFKIMNLERIFIIAKDKENSLTIIENKTNGGKK